MFSSAFWTVVAETVRADDQHVDLPMTHAVPPEMYATGFALADGLALNPKGDLFVTNYRVDGTIGRIQIDGTAQVFCNLPDLVPLEGTQPMASGLKIDGQGRLIVADAGAGRLLRISVDGRSAEVLADRWEGKRFESVNDVALDLEGNIYFTDSGGSSVKNPIGSVYRYGIHTTRVKRLVTGLADPNGLAITPDQKRLCVAESQRYRLLIFDLRSDGEADNRRVLYNFPTETRGEIIGGATPPDGMIFDAAGRLYVAMGSGGVIDVIDPASGEMIRQYDAGGAPATDCCFYGSYLYVTVAGKEAVFRLKLGVKGFDYAGQHAVLTMPESMAVRH
jgi:gluconolactonase